MTVAYHLFGVRAAMAMVAVFPVAGGAALYELNWFYPAFMVAVGAHYLPFVTMYGMNSFYVLGGVLIAGGLGLAFWVPESFAAGGWITGAVEMTFAGWFAFGSEPVG